MPDECHTASSSSPAPPAAGRRQAPAPGASANLFDQVCRRPQHERGRLALAVRDDAGHLTRYSYADLDDASAALAHVFVEEFGLRRGDAVGGILGRGAEAFVVALAAWRLGLVYVPIFIGFGAGQVAERLTTGEIRAVVVAAARLAVLESAMGEAGLDLPLVVAGSGQRGEHLDLEHVIESGPRSVGVAAVAAEDTATLMFTSGTTGNAKACVIPHSGWLATVPFLEHVLRLRSDDLVLSLSDPGWSYGLITTGVAVLAKGTPLLVQAGRFDVPKLISAMEHCRPTVVTGAPTAFRRLAAGLVESGKRLSVRTSSSGGEPLDTTTAATWKAVTASRLRDGYGLTELGMVLADVHDEDRTEGQLSALPGFETRLVDPDDLSRDVDEGRLLVRSRHRLSTGYANAPSAWADRLVGDGWFLTEDVFRRGANDRYVFRGRTDDIIVTSGYNVAAVDVEAAIRSHPGVADVAVTSTSLDGVGVAIRAAVVLRQPSSAGRSLVEEIQDLVRDRLGRHAYPRVVDFVEQLALTPSGKVRRLPSSAAADAEGQVKSR